MKRMIGGARKNAKTAMHGYADESQPQFVEPEAIAWTGISGEDGFVHCFFCEQPYKPVEDGCVSGFGTCESCNPGRVWMPAIKSGRPYNG
jgi:hypothetical protein